MTDLRVRCGAPYDDEALEIVEHKGLGHPDTICDAIAEDLSRELARVYVERFGVALHYNVDKALLFGGAARPRFGGGEVLAPMELYLAGRAAREASGVTIPLEEIAVDVGTRWLREHLHAVDVERHVKIHPLLRGGSEDLVALFGRGRRQPLANDTSIGVGYAPLSELETVVLATSSLLRTMAADRGTPHVGEDIKVLGVRRGRRMSLTVSCAFVDRFVPSLPAYIELRAEVAERLRARVDSLTECDVELLLDAGDDTSTGRVFLTVTGTSAEAGDDGEVGRGNRANALITPCRPMTMEAAAGKNPFSHVGKLYNVAANEIAAAIFGEVSGIASATCMLVSRIGRPVADPIAAEVAVDLRPGVALSDVTTHVERVVGERLAAMPELSGRLARDGVRVV